jgi:hypothetical protein
MIVIPTQEEVTLQFANGGVENFGWILTIGGLIAAIGGGVFYRMRDRPAASVARSGRRKPGRHSEPRGLRGISERDEA